jgi:hypothetical protein
VFSGPDNTRHVIIQQPIPKFRNTVKQISSSARPDTPHGIGICQSEDQKIATIPFVKEIFILLSARPP